MQTVGALERVLREATDGFFDDPGLREHLHVGLRVTLECAQLLSAHVDEPPSSELSYALGSIQSAIDSFILVSYAARTFEGLEAAFESRTPLPAGYAEIREAFAVRVEALSAANSNAVERLTALLHLFRIELAMLAVYFPWTNGA